MCTQPCVYTFTICVLYLLLQHKKVITRARPTHSSNSTEYCRIHNVKFACLLKGQHATIRLIIITPENSGVIFNRKIYEIPRAGSAGFMRWFSTVQVDSTRIDIIVLVPGIYSCRSKSGRPGSSIEHAGCERRVN